MELNGGSTVAMRGKDCVAIACDLRLGNQALTIATNFEKVRALAESVHSFFAHTSTHRSSKQPTRRTLDWQDWRRT